MWDFATTTCLYILTDGQMSGVITEVTVNESGEQSESRISLGRSKIDQLSSTLHLYVAEKDQTVSL